MRGASNADPLPDHARDADPVAWDHRVQFYDEDDVLCASVAAYLAEGLTAGGTVVVLCTRGHRDMVIEHLKASGLDWEEGRRDGRIRWLDAREALELVMMGREPDRRNFDQYIGEVIRDTVHLGDRVRVRAYGELVDILWQEGFEDAALQLEDMWNDLGRTHRFSLLCGYATGSPRQENGRRRYRDVCERHAQIISLGERAHR